MSLPGYCLTVTSNALGSVTPFVSPLPKWSGCLPVSMA